MVAALFFGANFNSSNVSSNEYKKVANERDSAVEVVNTYKALGYDKVKSELGFGSHSYYAGLPVVFVKAGDKGSKIPIYFSLKDKSALSVRETTATNIVGGEWDWKDFSKDWGAFIVWGKKAGVYNLHFHNKINSDAFDVLVVVK